MQTTLTNREILEALFDGDTFHSPDFEYQFRSEAFTAEIPQTGERFESREELRDLQRALGPPPQVMLRRITGDGDVWVVETTQTYGLDDVAHVCVVVEFNDGLIVRETRYYAPPTPTNRS